MLQLINKTNWQTLAPASFVHDAPDMTRVVELTENERIEVLTFLSVRPVHTVVMSSFIADNGMVSELNRGKFYGYRGIHGGLEGRPHRPFNPSRSPHQPRDRSVGDYRSDQ